MRERLFERLRFVSDARQVAAISRPSLRSGGRCCHPCRSVNHNPALACGTPRAGLFVWSYTSSSMWPEG